MHIDFLLDRAAVNREAEAMIWNKTPYTYGWLLERIASTGAELAERGISPGDVVALEADFSPYMAAVLLALMERGCIIVPLVSSMAESVKLEYREIAQVEKWIRVEADAWQVTFTSEEPAAHE